MTEHIAPEGGAWFQGMMRVAGRPPVSPDQVLLSPVRHSNIALIDPQLAGSVLVGSQGSSPIMP